MKYVVERDPSAMAKVVILASASPTELNGPKLDSNLV